MTTATKASKPTKGPKKKGIPRELMNLIGTSNECFGHHILPMMYQDRALGAGDNRIWLAHHQDTEPFLTHDLFLSQARMVSPHSPP
jgi:hypothetical protein